MRTPSVLAHGQVDVWDQLETEPATTCQRLLLLSHTRMNFSVLLN